MKNSQSDKLSRISIVKSAGLQALIDILNNTTVGTLSSSIDSNSADIVTINTSITNINTQAATNANDIAAINTSITDINTQATTNANDIAAINTSITDINTQATTNANDIAAINASIQTLTDIDTLINSKIDSIALLFGIVFNTDGTISTQNYTAHTHSYSDVSIEDTADATGLTNTDTKTTQGVA